MQERAQRSSTLAYRGMTTMPPAWCLHPDWHLSVYKRQSREPEAAQVSQNVIDDIKRYIYIYYYIFPIIYYIIYIFCRRFGSSADFLLPWCLHPVSTLAFPLMTSLPPLWCLHPVWHLSIRFNISASTRSTLGSPRLPKCSRMSQVIKSIYISYYVASYLGSPRLPKCSRLSQVIKSIYISYYFASYYI